MNNTSTQNTADCVCKTRQRSGALHLTQKVDYGLIILTFLAKNPQLSIKKISEESHVSFLFLQKIAGLLQKAGLVKAERGKFGGYKLNKTPEQINVREIIEALEGPISLVPCLKKPGTSGLPSLPAGLQGLPAGQAGCKHESYCTIRPGMAKLNAEIQNNIINKTLNYFIT